MLIPREMAQLSSLTAEYLGLHFPPPRWRDLAKGLQAAAPELGFADAPELADHLLSAPVTREVLEVLASHLTIGETYFFREKNLFEVLEEQLMPRLLASREGTGKCLRIWSAGCASGEEAYSIAIMLHRQVAHLQDWQIMLLATDVSQKALQKAAAGVYSPWSFRSAPAWLAEKYFTRRPGDRWEINPWIKKMVTFAYLNLAQDPFPTPLNHTAGLDMIFCRNVLMYFAPQVVPRVVANLAAALAPGGWLIVSPAECSLLQGAGLVACSHPGAILFQKTDDQTRGPSFGSRGETSTRLSDDRFKPATPSPEGRPDQPAALQVWSASRGPEAVPGLRRPGQETAAVVSGSPSPVLPTGSRLGAPSAGATDRVSGESGAGTENCRPAAENGDAGDMALMARLNADQGRLEEARTWGEKAIAADLLNPEHYYLLASILQELSQKDEAVALLKKALYLQHDFVLAHFSLGNLAVQQHRLVEAEKYFNNVLALLKDSANDDLIPSSEGLTSGALREVVQNIQHRLSAR